MIWANLLHLSYNMWEDRYVAAPEVRDRSYRPYLRFSDKLWDTLLKRMVDAGANMVVIDLGDGVKYQSHPEIAVKGAWTTKRLTRELTRLRDMGLEPIPKLNFSTSHDAWLGPYERMVSTDTYYQVCGDLIGEVVDLFDRPRFFHLGMDEETAGHQGYYEYVAVRQHDLWWKDLKFLVRQVEQNKSRPWIWSDYMWEHRDEFLKRMPRRVLQSNWYYWRSFSRRNRRVEAYHDLNERGYDQIPTGSNWLFSDNLLWNARFARRHLDPKHLLGFLQTPWRSTLLKWKQHHLQAIDQIAQARRYWERTA